MGHLQPDPTIERLNPSAVDWGTSIAEPIVMSEIVENRLIQTASPGLREVLVISLLPMALIATLFILRSDAGPFWQWRALDPSYIYLFDALNILNLQLPGT